MGPFEQLSVAGRVTPNAMEQREGEHERAGTRRGPRLCCESSLGRVSMVTDSRGGRPAAAGTESLEFEASLPLLLGELPRTVFTFAIV